MTQITQSDVHHLAQLSSLQLDDTEVEALRGDLENILGYIEQLSELDTSGVEPTYQVTDLTNVWRDDVVDDYGVNRETLLSLAPEAEQNQIKVPKVL
jgi:aspartyl-tRNA(Asn)/glutamyl-tRNA(Gln) amidotransferase subunit C